MRADGVAIGIAMMLAACSGPDPQPIDAPDAPVDAADAPDPDAPTDAPADAAIDAATDAAVIDAPLVDAPTDAPAVDAPTDAPAVDAPTDATPIDAPDPLTGWPTPVAPQLLGSGSQYFRCHAAGEHHFAWGLISYPFTVTAFVHLDDRFVQQQGGAVVGCTVGVSAAGTLMHAFTLEGQTSLYQESVAIASIPYPHAILAIDPAGSGSLVEFYDSTGELRLHHLSPTLTVDPGFGTGGALVIPAPVEERVLQATSGAPVVTFRIGSMLRRIALDTGAPVTAFGGTGTVILPTLPGEVVGLTDLPGLGVALVTRGAATDQLAIVRLDATGAIAAPQIVTLPAAIERATVDNHGRIVVALTTTPTAVRLTRLLASTGAVDPSFGTAGRATAAITYTCPPSTGFGGGHWLLLDALGDGRVALGTEYDCNALFPPPVYTLHQASAYLFTD